MKISKQLSKLKKMFQEPKKDFRKGRHFESASGEKVDCVDEAGEESFPASDPPSHSPITHV